MRTIKNDLIFAAGMGTRLHPLTLATPKPLLKVNGTPMIESIIASMIANGIEKIYIVIGYKKEKFYYLQDKYLEVEFLENKDYQTRNTISSLYYARNVLNNDFIISEGDLSISDSSIFSPKIDRSQYLYTPNQMQNDEWGFYIDYLTNTVLEIRPPEETVYLNNNLYGVSFWLKEDLKIVLDEVLKEYSNPKYRDAAYDELVNNVIDKLEIGVRPVSSNQITEIDSLDELFEADPTYSIFKSIDLLKKILNIDRKDITKIYENPGRSLNNYNYVVEVGPAKYILRIPGIGTELFNDRANEKDAYFQLKNSNLAEENYFLDAVSGIKISKYYPNSKKIDTSNEAELKSLMVKLRMLHSAEYIFSADNVFNRIKRYDSYVACVGGRKNYQQEFIAIQKEIFNMEAEFSLTLDVKPIHGDLSPNNVIVTEEGEVLLIDLEFICMDDPFMDLANFSHDGELSPDQTIRLLELYLERKPSKEEMKKVFALCASISTMWYSWAVFKMTVEVDDFEKFKQYRDHYLKYAQIYLDETKKY